MSFGESLRKAVDSEIIQPPKGPYKVRLDEASAFESAKGEFVKVTLEITDGDLAGSRFEHWMRFNSEMQRNMSGEALAAYGVDLTKVEEIFDIDDQLGALVKAETAADVSVSYGGNEGQFLNVKVHGSRTAGVSDIPTDDGPEQKPAASFAAAAKSDDSSIPF